jgi:DNA-binding beta-propeller fold protein YncE
MIQSGKVRRFCVVVAALASAALFSDSYPGVLPALFAQEPLPAPQWIGLYDLKGKAGLKWIPDPRYHRIRILRRQKGGDGKFRVIAETEEVQYIDTEVVSGKAYVYRLVAVDPKGLLSLPSADRSLGVTEGRKKVVSAPKWEAYLFTEEGIGLKWSRLPGKNALAYNIYRKTVGDTEFQLIGSTSTGTHHEDKNVEPGKTYIYVLSALDSSFRESPFSAELEVPYPEEKAVSDKGEGKEIVWRARRTRLVNVITGGRVPFARPADVILGPKTGDVYVTDTGTGQIQVFSADGSFLRVLGGGKEGQPIIRAPLGLAVDDEEQIYVIDGSLNSVGLITPEGSFRRWTGMARLFPDTKMGLIDAAVGPDGKVFVVDNYNSRVAIVGGDRGGSFFGEKGSHAGQLSAPTFCTFDDKGFFYLSDGLNGRVQVFDSVGRFVRGFGQYRQGPGGLGRPKGVAVNEKGEVFVADSWQNMVQVFDQEGRFLAVLTDENGDKLDLGSPNGIALGANNRIYIVERLSRRLHIREMIQ